MAGRFIKDVELIDNVKDEYKFPISADDLLAHTASFKQTKDYIRQGLVEDAIDLKPYARAKGSWVDMSDTMHSMDVTPLYTAMTKKTALDEKFYNELIDAIDHSKLLYISDKSEQPLVTVDLLVVYINKKENELLFSAFDGRTSYMLLLNAQTRMVSLDTERIGVEFNIYNNTMGVNLFNLNKDSSNEDIKLCLINARDEIIIPDTGDVFNIYENSHLNESALVISRTDDGAGTVKMRTLRNDFVDNLIVFDFFGFSYDPNRGVDSLRLETRIENIVDPALITSDKMNAIRSGLVRVFDASELLSHFNSPNTHLTKDFITKLKTAVDLGYLIQVKDTISSPGETNIINMSISSYDEQELCLISASETTINKITVNLHDYTVSMSIHETIAPPPNDDIYYVMHNGVWVDINDALGPIAAKVDKINKENI